MSTVKKNYIYQIFYQLLISILPFITSPYLARVIGAEGIGIYSYTYSIVIYFKLFAALGISDYGNRAIAKAKADDEKLSETFSSIFVLHAILSLCAIVAYFIYSNYFVTENKIIVIIQIFYLVGELLDINWFYFGIEKFKLTVARNAIIKILTVLFIFIFVKSKEDLWKYVLILALGTMISTSAVWLFLPRYVHFKRFKLNEMILHIKPMAVLFFAAIGVSVFGYMDKIMLGYLSSMTEVGYYENACKMIEFPVGFITALGTVMLPKISYYLSLGKEADIQKYVIKSMRFSALISIAIFFGLLAIATDFSVIFWSENFFESGVLIKLLSVTIILKAWNSVIRSQILIPREMDRVYLYAIILAMFVNLLINYVLIPVYQARGVAVGTVLSYTCISIIQTWYSKQLIPIKQVVLSSLPYMVIGGIMYCCIAFLRYFMTLSIVTLILEVVIGITVYCGLSFFYAHYQKDDFVLDAIKQVTKKIIYK